MGQKQHLVRNAIYEAAIDLFATHGFDETTVEEVAQAAGVSRRSLFRYFSSKDDLLAHSVMNYQHVLQTAIESCPPGTSPLKLMRAAVSAGARHVDSEVLTRTVIEISSRTVSARQAQQSRMMELADSLEEAFKRTLRITQKGDSRPRLYANLTVVILNVAIQSWFGGEHENIPAAAEQELYETMRVFSEEADNLPPIELQEKRRRSTPSRGVQTVPRRSKTKTLRKSTKERR
jgi:AcrR family transcriptional regulator